MTARTRRIESDFEQIKKDFSGHKYIHVSPVGGEPPEKYKITYFVNGIYLLPDGVIQNLGRHEVEIVLHAEYPRYKPICTINTPIWHPNFRDGQICIGDIWGAGESLSDIIINIGDMIQYKSWNSFSPLCADAAKWAIENKHLFPLGSLNLYKADFSEAKNMDFDIDVFSTDDNAKDTNSNAGENVVFRDSEHPLHQTVTPRDSSITEQAITAGSKKTTNDIEITSEELVGIEFVPTAQRMQTVSHGATVSGQKINFKTVLMKGLLWGLIGGILGFILQEILNGPTDSEAVLGWLGYSTFDLYGLSEYRALSIIKQAVRISTALFSAMIAGSVGMLLGVGEGIYYGSKDNAVKYGAIGIGVSVALGFVSGYIAQWLYSGLISDYASDFYSAFVRGIGWAIMGAGVGLAVGLIKPEKKRLLFCLFGGLGGGFFGGFLFDYVNEIFNTGYNDTGTFARAIAIVIMGVLIGLGIGLLEQYAKQAWLKVIRGEFEGKEYLVFSGTTSIGNNGKNTIVLFKDKLVGPNHCDIILEGNKYVLIDKGTPMGTIVNGMRVQRHILKNGDAVSIGNSVLVFNTK